MGGVSPGRLPEERSKDEMWVNRRQWRERIGRWRRTPTKKEQDVQKEAEMEVKEEEEMKLSSFAEYDTRKLVAIFNNFNTEAECKVNLQNNLQKPVVFHISAWWDGVRWRSWTHF